MSDMSASAPAANYVLVSACLLGSPVRYNGADKRSDNPVLRRWQAEGRVISVCPEVAGGLPVPRPPAEMEGGAGGGRVLSGQIRVVGPEGRDVSAAFVRGAESALQLAQRHRIKLAVLKEGSPSCGSGYVYDGTFSGVRRPELGVTSALLEANGIKVFSELQWAEAEAYLQQL